jgi:hypothetical protein
MSVGETCAPGQCSPGYARNIFADQCQACGQPGQICCETYPQCAIGYTCTGGVCQYTCPIVVDVDGSGYHLTDSAGDVKFDFFNSGHPIQISWSRPGSTNAFLVLDRNGDGIIDRRDAIDSKRRLWIDANHNGVSEPKELHPLPELGVDWISLDYQLSKRVDEYGNAFPYRAQIDTDSPGAKRADR